MISTGASDTPVAKRQRSITTGEDLKKYFCAMTREKLVLHTKDALTIAELRVDSREENLLPPFSMFTASVEQPPQIDPLVVMHEHQRQRVCQVYIEISSAQNLIFTELGIVHNDAHDMARVAEWIFEIAQKRCMTTETVHSGLYLYFTYMAHVQKHCGNSEEDDDCGSFELYRNRLVMVMKNDDRNRISYAISATFCQNLARNDNKLLIAATCLCMAAKMEESHFDTMIKPSQIILDMKLIGHPVGQNKEFDFITVERDILEKLRWRLFRVHTPIPFLKMLFVCYATSKKSQLAACELLSVCMSSKKYVSTQPSELAALCLVTALHANKGLYGSAADIVGISHLTNLNVEVLLQHSDAIRILRGQSDIKNCNRSNVQDAAVSLESAPFFVSTMGMC